MTSPGTLCSSCLRRIRASHLRIPNQALRLSAATAAGAFSTPERPLLDFLAPSITLSQNAVPRPVPTRFFTHSARVFQELASSSRPTAKSPPTAQPAIAIPPRTDGEGKPMSVHITPRAAHRLSRLAEADHNPNLALRISVESGGCHGFQYLMSLTTLEPEELNGEHAEEKVAAMTTGTPIEDEDVEGFQDEDPQDTVFVGPKESKVVIDMASLELLNGSTVDYTMELIGSQFKVVGIPGATSSCGCGTSFDVKL